jgi:hypothetical protein
MHRGIGRIPEEVRERMGEGWGFLFEQIREIAE